MAWDDEMVTTLRILINDFDEEPKFDDDRLRQIVLAAAKAVQSTASFGVAYDADIINLFLRPDPTRDPRDDVFINLVILKAACIIAVAEVREFTGQGISIRDGTSAISLNRSPASLRLMKDTYCREYTDALTAYNRGAIEGLGGAILGPIRAGHGNPLFSGPYGGPPERVYRGHTGPEEWY